MRVRAWDGKYMVYHRYSEDFSLNLGYLFTFFGELKYSCDHLGRKHILMRCLDMVDCGSNWIYEGDIVELQVDKLSEEDRAYFESVRYEVIYRERNALFAFKVIGKEDTYNIVDQKVVCQLYRVIGNIYENPELIGGE